MVAGDFQPPSSAEQWDARLEPLLSLSRGGLPETVYRGVLAVADRDGQVVAAIGDPEAGVHLRSAAKPFQALALVESGAASAFSFSPEELAIACASHSGTEEHLALVDGILRRIGLSEDHLECGTLPPLDQLEAERLRRTGVAFRPLHHMCSGKHAGMLALARYLGTDPGGYSQPSHPVQRLIFSTLSGETGLAPDLMMDGTDGCGVPVLYLPARLCAMLYARLASGATRSFALLRDAMRAHPRLIAGEGRLDTRLMKAGGGSFVCKSGAGGVLGIGRIAQAGGDHLGSILKLAADPGRYTAAIAAEELSAWGAGDVADAIWKREDNDVVNAMGTVVGTVSCTEALRRALGRSGGGEPFPGRPPGDEPSRAGDLPAIRLEGFGQALTSFLEREWPAAERETVGTVYPWTAQPLAVAARRGRRVVGVATGNLVGGVLELAELLVASGERGAGIGSALLAAIEAETWKRDGHRAAVQVWAGSAAETFYRRRGYVQLSILPGHYQRGVQALLVKDRAEPEWSRPTAEERPV